MARDRANVRIDIWADQEWRDLSGSAQLLGMFCMASGLRGPKYPARVVRHTGWTREFVDAGIRELNTSPYSYLVYVDTTRRRMPQTLANTVFARDSFMCRNCGTSRRLTVDHIWPVSRGGDDSLDNLQTLCHSCNSKKGARI